jgi:flagellar protein FlaF
VNLANQTHRPYGQIAAPTRSPRAVEYDLLARVTRRLQSAWTNRRIDFPELASAVSDNTAIWSTLGLDVANPDNQLPEALRAQIFYLYQFSELHGRKVLDGKASVEVLIDINMAVMRGLRGQAGDLA